MHCPDKSGQYRLTLSYSNLEARSNVIASGLKQHGITHGTRIVVMLRPTPEFFIVMIALFKARAIPILIDPGIQKRALKQCLDDAEPEVFIGIPAAILAAKVLGWARTARLKITTGTWPLFSDLTLDQLEHIGAAKPVQIADSRPNDIAAIAFTSGSTGIPKGVVYRHRHLISQVNILREIFNLTQGGIDLSTFPPFALFNPALGLTSVIPDMNPTKPAQADPEKLLTAIKRFGITQLFGSPALLHVLIKHGAPLTTVKHVLSAGASIPPSVIVGMQGILPDDAQLWTAYGATECLPVTIIESRELQKTHAQTETGSGVCVGHPVAQNKVRIIRISDDFIPVWSDDLQVTSEEIGEITVTGPTTTETYYNRDKETQLAKIHEYLANGNKRIVHRMGDLGWFDHSGRLWFCGRKSQRVIVNATTTLFTEQVEPVYNTHPCVRRTALVGVGLSSIHPVLCVEAHAKIRPRNYPRIIEELQQLSCISSQTAMVQTFLFHPGFPLDIRHNAKINREKLALWATRKFSNTHFSLPQ